MLLCIIPFLFEFAINFQSIWVNIESMIVGLHCLALENTAQLCYKVAVCTCQQQWGRLLFPHPPAVDIVIYMEFSSPKRSGVISHDFNLLFFNSMIFFNLILVRYLLSIYLFWPGVCSHPYPIFYGVVLEVFICFESRRFIRYVVYKYFSPSSWFVFWPYESGLSESKYLIL